jgi:hypothetical protein
MDEQSVGQSVASIEKFFLDRLQRFARIAATAESRDISQWSRLARHSVLSAYRDCAAIGLEREARAILDETQGREALSA